MTKTNAEIILRKWLNKHFSISKGLYLPIEPKLDKLYDLSKMAGIDGYKRGRAEERKKYTNTGKVLQCNSTNTKPKITREQLIQLTLWSYEITIDDENYEKYLKLTEKNIKAMGLEVEK